MKKFISMYFEKDNAGVLDAMKDKVLPRSDSRLWSDEYSVVRGTTEEGMPFLCVALFFNTESARGNFRSFMGPFNGMKGTIREADSYHDEKDGNNNVVRQCELTELIEVVV